MTRPGGKGAFVSRPGDPDRWIKANEHPRSESGNTARLTLDVTPAMRRRLKLAALGRGLTLADMLRELLAREFPDSSGEGS